MNTPMHPPGSKKRAVYPGSFDPPHLGHVDLIERTAKIFDEVIVLIAVAPDKTPLFSVEERQTLLTDLMKDHPNVKVMSHGGLTVEFMHEHDARILIRGLRAVVDFESELSMAQMNHHLAPEIETVVMLSSPQLGFISSRAVKEVARHGGSLMNLVPDLVLKAIQNRRS